MADELLDGIKTNMADPFAAEQDGTRAQQHNLKDQIAAHKYVKSQEVFDEVTPTGIGFRMMRFTPPGAP